MVDYVNIELVHVAVVGLASAKSLPSLMSLVDRLGAAPKKQFFFFFQFKMVLRPDPCANGWVISTLVKYSQILSKKQFMFPENVITSLEDLVLHSVLASNMHGQSGNCA